MKQKHGGEQEILIDAKPLIILMKIEAPDMLRLILRFAPGRTIKPELVLGAWLPPAQSAEERGWKILRKQLYWETSSGALSAP